MDLLIAYAACTAPESRALLAGLKLPNLQQLLARLPPVDAAADTLAAAPAASAQSLSMPHEVALAGWLGLPTTDGQIPWAARLAQQSGLAAGQELGTHAGAHAWAFITPCHWQVGTDQITLADPTRLALESADAQALHAAMQAYFAEDGITLLPQLHALPAGQSWLAHSPIFDGLVTASPQRVVGKSVNAWMPEAAQAAPLRRLQNEMQMLLYTHPVNDVRTAQCLPPVNSFWVHGAGRLAALPAAPPGLLQAHDLASPALQHDWPAWAQAWQQLDATHCAALLQAVHGAAQEAHSLTLCGEQGFMRCASTPGVKHSPWLNRIKNFFNPSPNLSERLPL